MKVELPEPNGLNVFHVEHPKAVNHYFKVLVSIDGAWEHVSVTLFKRDGKKFNWVERTPTWKEMCFIKDLFFHDEDEVVQFHPKKSQYVNIHNYALHLWRMIDQEKWRSVVDGDKTEVVKMIPEKSPV